MKATVQEKMKYQRLGLLGRAESGLYVYLKGKLFLKVGETQAYCNNCVCWVRRKVPEGLVLLIFASLPRCPEKAPVVTPVGLVGWGR